MARIFITLISIIIAISASHAIKHDPYDMPRIFWDVNTQQEIFPNGNYARIIQLQDGRLMAVAETSQGISCCYSNDAGHTWTAPQLIIRSADKIPYAVPDFIQLSDGTIIVGYNTRPSQPYSENRRFGIRTIRSTDNGMTWEDPVHAYDASHIFTDGCWEPAFLELPSGELQLYFANENNFTDSDEQEISMCRSFDRGNSWSDAIRVCYRPGSRDGMPVPILTDNGEIVVIIEDNGHPGLRGFRATTVRTPLDRNWENWIDASSPERQIIFANDADKRYISAAPYISKLKSGEMIASWQGDYGDRAGSGENHYGMFVAVGDKDARHFRGITEPFALPENKHALWNSVAVTDSGEVFAIASIGGNGKPNAITIIKGYPIASFTAAYGKPSDTNRIIMGNTSKQYSTIAFGHNEDYLFFHANVSGLEIKESDGVTLSIDAANICSTEPQTGMYIFDIATNGTLKLSEGDSGKWKTINKSSKIKHRVSIENDHYDIELSIPLEMLEVTEERPMRCNIEIRHDSMRDTIPATTSFQSYTWPQLRQAPKQRIKSR